MAFKYQKGDKVIIRTPFGSGNENSDKKATIVEAFTAAAGDQTNNYYKVRIEGRSPRYTPVYGERNLERTP